MQFEVNGPENYAIENVGPKESVEPFANYVQAILGPNQGKPIANPGDDSVPDEKDELSAALDQIVSVVQDLTAESEVADESEATPPPPNQFSADEIRKLAELMEDGYITPEEFEARKRQLLGL